MVDNSKITVPVDGVYNLQFSAQLKNIDNAQHITTIWVKINGNDLPNSASQITVPARKNNFIFGYALPAWNFFLDLNAGDYVELYWLVDSTLVTMPAIAASTTPAYPAIPSVIVTMTQV